MQPTLWYLGFKHHNFSSLLALNQGIFAQLLLFFFFFFVLMSSLAGDLCAGLLLLLPLLLKVIAGQSVCGKLEKNKQDFRLSFPLSIPLR